MDSTAAKQWKRQSFEQAMDLVRVPNSSENSSKTAGAYRYMSTQPAWNAGSLFAGTGRDIKAAQSGVFGGTVYAQAPLAAARSIELEDSQSNGDGTKPNFGIHVSNNL